MDARAAFDPKNPFDACADRLRRAVAEIAGELNESPQFKGLAAEQQIVCMMAGLMTGVMGVLLCFVEPDGHDAFVQALADYLPDARQNAYDIMANSPEGRFQ